MHSRAALHFHMGDHKVMMLARDILFKFRSESIHVTLLCLSFLCFVFLRKQKFSLLFHLLQCEKTKGWSANNCFCLHKFREPFGLPQMMMTMTMTMYLCTSCIDMRMSCHFIQFDSIHFIPLSWLMLFVYEDREVFYDEINFYDSCPQNDLPPLNDWLIYLYHC